MLERRVRRMFEVRVDRAVEELREVLEHKEAGAPLRRLGAEEVADMALDFVWMHCVPRTRTHRPDFVRLSSRLN
jgi:hypothetical protein